LPPNGITALYKYYYYETPLIAKLFLDLVLMTSYNMTTLGRGEGFAEKNWIVAKMLANSDLTTSDAK